MLQVVMLFAKHRKIRAEDNENLDEHSGVGDDYHETQNEAYTSTATKVALCRTVLAPPPL